MTDGLVVTDGPGGPVPMGGPGGPLPAGGPVPAHSAVPAGGAVAASSGGGGGLGGADARPLVVDRLSVTLGSHRLLREVSFSLPADSIFGLAGESGSGKSLTCLSILRLQPAAMQVTGSVTFGGLELLGLTGAALRSFHARRARIVFQDPASTFDPLMTVGAQLVESVRAAEPVGKGEARARAIDMLAEVGIPEPAQRFGARPRELSGGMLQRASIAMALLAVPDLLICDEPTTALDATTAVQILELIRRLAGEHHVSVLLTSHDLSVVADYCTRVAVMYGGEVVETGPARQVIEHPSHPYTWSLVSAAPGRSSVAPRTPLPTIPGHGARPDERLPGCRFEPRCPFAEEACSAQHPVLRPATDPATERADACLVRPDLPGTVAAATPGAS